MNTIYNGVPDSRSSISCDTVSVNIRGELQLIDRRAIGHIYHFL